MISKKPSIQYIWEFPLTIKTNTIKQAVALHFHISIFPLLKIPSFKDSRI